MKTTVALIFLLLSLCTTIAEAQCATGVDTGGQCIPPDALKPQDDSNQPRNQSKQPRAVWADRWGAISTDSSGDAGTAENRPSEDEAIQIATSICAQNGASHCEVLISYHNQCAAAALGGGHLKGSSAPNKSEAEQQALNHCGGSNVCKIVYSACSLPARIQ